MGKDVDLGWIGSLVSFTRRTVSGVADSHSLFERLENKVGVLTGCQVQVAAPLRHEPVLDLAECERPPTDKKRGIRGNRQI